MTNICFYISDYGYASKDIAIKEVVLDYVI